MMLAGLVCLLHFVKDLGWSLAKKLLSKEETLKVTLLNDQAHLAVKGMAQAAGRDLASSVRTQLGWGRESSFRWASLLRFLPGAMEGLPPGVHLPAEELMWWGA